MFLCAIFYRTSLIKYLFGFLACFFNWRVCFFLTEFYTLQKQVFLIIYAVCKFFFPSRAGLFILLIVSFESYRIQIDMCDEVGKALK